MTASGGGCFDFAVGSGIPFRYLRAGGTDPLEVVEQRSSPDAPTGDPLIEWRPRADHPFHARLHAGGEGYRFWVDGLGTYDVRPGGALPRIVVPAGADPIGREERLWGIPAVLCFLARGDHSLHAGSVDLGGRAVAFGAPGRYGKTTLAAAFVAAGHRLLAEDSTCVRTTGAGASAVPGPAMLRVRRDTFEHLAVPGATVIARDDDRVHLSLDLERRGTCDPVPLAGVVLLRAWEEDTCRLEPVSTDDAIPDLWALSFHPPTDDGRAACFDRIAALVAAVPVWNLYRPLRYDRLPQVIDLIAEATPLP
jgi:hypothetical protein